jgi:hypothetical protein
MRCTNPIILTKNVDRKKYPDGLEVPCGKCFLCRITQRKEWSMRMIHELTDWQRASFITLTYENEKLPPNASLNKKHLQDFFKRVRYYLAKQDRNIKYFACGEYGSQTERPHYHAIMFGLGLEPEDKKVVMVNWPFCDWDQPTIKSKSFGIAEPHSIGYVAQYIDKKLTGDLAEEEYQLKGREPIFSLKSNGIGKNYVLRNRDHIINQERITVNGVVQSFPRYYLKLLELEDSDFRKLNAIEKSIKEVKRYTGETKEFIEFYKTASSDDIKKFCDGQRLRRRQKALTLLAKHDMYEKKL